VHSVVESLKQGLEIDWPFIKSRRLSLAYPLEMYSKFVLPIGFCLAKYKNWLENGHCYFKLWMVDST